MNLLNCKEYIETFLKIKTKSGKLVPLKLNQPQQRLYDVIAKQYNANKPVRVIILKARQMGFSTLSEGITFWGTATSENTDSLIIAHKDEATANLFRMSQLFYEQLPSAIKPMLQASNAQELNFNRPTRDKSDRQGMRSRIRCATAGGKGQGRSYTLRIVHMSELAFWPGNKLETYSGIMQAVPDEAGTIVIVESTANGFDFYKDLWEMAVESQRSGNEDGFIPVFFPWYEMKDYRRAVPHNFELTEEEEQLKKTYELDDEQIAWRRWCIEVNCGGDVNKFKQEYPASPDEAFISTGTCVFDKDAIVKRRKQVLDEKWEYGRFTYKYDGEHITDIKWQPEKNGIIRIKNKPEKGKPYVIGGDTAGTGSDNFIGIVLDNTNGEQIAVLQQLMGEVEYTRQMYCLGMYYNTALMGIETNYTTYPIQELQRLHYPRQYVRQRLDTYTKKTMEEYGYNTTPSTRPTMIDHLKAVAHESLELITDYTTLGEMLTFVYNEDWRPEAEVGKHDDHVMALAIAHEIRPQQSTAIDLSESGVKWSADMWEDYNNASPAEREYLIQRWGSPAR